MIGPVVREFQIKASIMRGEMIRAADLEATRAVRLHNKSTRVGPTGPRPLKIWFQNFYVWSRDEASVCAPPPSPRGGKDGTLKSKVEFGGKREWTGSGQRAKHYSSLRTLQNRSGRFCHVGVPASLEKPATDQAAIRARPSLGCCAPWSRNASASWLSLRANTCIA